MATKHTLLCYSSAHLRKEDATLADRLSADPEAPTGCAHFVATTGYGWLFWVAPAEEGESAVQYEDLAAMGFSEALAAVLDHAVRRRKTGVYVMFDCDEEPNEDLPAFDW